jgi:hypothetical protein
MKTNNIASYSEALVACMRQNPIWILLAEVRSAEAVMAVRNSISSGHHVISTIHADKASSIPMRMYALLEGSQDIDQYLCSIHRYVQIGIYVKGYYSQVLGRFQREIMEICEFYVDDVTNRPMANILYSKTLDGRVTLRNPTKKLIDYLAIGNIYFDTDDIFGLGDAESKEDLSNLRDGSADNLALKKTSSEALNNALNGTTAEDGTSAKWTEGIQVETATGASNNVETLDDDLQTLATPDVASQSQVVPTTPAVVAPIPQTPAVSSVKSPQPTTTNIQPTVVAPAPTVATAPASFDANVSAASTVESL